MTEQLTLSFFHYIINKVSSSARVSYFLFSQSVVWSYFSLSHQMYDLLFCILVLDFILMFTKNTALTFSCTSDTECVLTFFTYKFKLTHYKDVKSE